MSKPVVCSEFCSDKTKVAAARRLLPPPAELRRRAEALSLLADPGRLAILMALRGGELCVCDLSRVLGAGVSAVSHQLRLLRAAGLVTCRGQGKLVFYSYSGGRAAADALRAIAVLSGEGK